MKIVFNLCENFCMETVIIFITLRRYSDSNCCLLIAFGLLCKKNKCLQTVSCQLFRISKYSNLGNGCDLGNSCDFGNCCDLGNSCDFGNCTELRKYSESKLLGHLAAITRIFLAYLTSNKLSFELLASHSMC